jgi:hypothetical protein
MALSWIEKLVGYFGKPMDILGVVKDVEEKVEEVELTPVGKIRQSFNPLTDLIVLSRDFWKEITDEDADWLGTHGDKLIFFEGNTLINIAVIKAGRSYSGSSFKFPSSIRD